MTNCENKIYTILIQSELHNFLIAFASHFTFFCKWWLSAMLDF